jgi:hypothetical protein
MLTVKGVSPLKADGERGFHRQRLKVKRVSPSKADGEMGFTVKG